MKLQRLTALRQTDSECKTGMSLLLSSGEALFVWRSALKLCGFHR